MNEKGRAALRTSVFFFGNDLLHGASIGHGHSHPAPLALGSAVEQASFASGVDKLI